ncbi:MAG: hypothetical protein E5X61_02825 [Mesorhizobium sp.]|nr:MAG: hypothetical protein E5X61_02825 [Mesorhizobium sp.]
MMLGTSSTRYLIGSRRAKAKGGGNPMGCRGYLSPSSLSWSVYADKADAHDFSINLDSWGINTGGTSNPMTALVATQNPDAGIGQSPIRAAIQIPISMPNWLWRSGRWTMPNAKRCSRNSAGSSSTTLP